MYIGQPGGEAGKAAVEAGESGRREITGALKVFYDLFFEFRLVGPAPRFTSLIIMFHGVVIQHHLFGVDVLASYRWMKYRHSCHT